MSAVTKTVSSTHTYCGNNYEINFYSDDEEGLSVTIDTERLHMRSVTPTEKDYNNYAALFGDKNVMEKFATGETKSKEDIKKRIDDVWVKRWKEGDPYNGFAVTNKDSDTFLGHVALGHGSQEGQSELAYLFHQAEWGKGYASEAVDAVVKQYAPATVQEGYTLKGKTIKKIVATVRPDNPASVRVLEKVGMRYVSEEEKFGALRHNYAIDLSELQKK